MTQEEKSVTCSERWPWDPGVALLSRGARIFKEAFGPLFFFVAVLEFELRALPLLGRFSTT
jgi:hypothetical protein